MQHGIEDSSSPIHPVPTLARLTEEDAPFWLLHRGVGWSVVQQMVWTFPDEVAKDSLRQLNSALTHGRLHRRLVEARVPGARPYWVRATQPVPLAFDDEPIVDEQLADWAVAELRTVDLDPDDGRCWRLRAAVTSSGHTVLSLCTLHLVADGAARIEAVAAALRLCEALGVENTGDRPVPHVQVAPETSRRADLVDAARQVGVTSLGLLRVLGQTIRRDRDETPTDPRPPRAPLADRAPTATPVWATATVPADDWDQIASRHGGTANSLFVAVVCGMLRAAGYTAPENPVKVGLPVSDRAEGDERSNAVAGVTLYLTPVPKAAADLTAVRDACRQAYTKLAGGQRSAMAHLRPLAWLVPPTRLAGLSGSDAAYPDAVASNVGQLPPELLVIGGVRAYAVTVRGMAQGVDPAGRHRYGDGVQAWLTRTDTDVTVTVSGFDEKSFVDDDTFRRVLADELRAWGLPHRIW
ncbi:hypothetical protein V1Y59_18470 [Gordonia sp. PKS22-38]|uniref:Condensation domain-containing protein n=1 Tax=Gordonia prachuapensis TaxID=3115651 RepID=A0ABU7MY53_9ACTN|nr:hypothetical protein [Gordonia sp. PKS22-38]